MSSGYQHKAPEPEMWKTRELFYLYAFSQGVEYLWADLDSSEEILFSTNIDDFLTGVMPVEVHNGFLQPEKVVDSSVDQINACCVARLSSQIVLEV